MLKHFKNTLKFCSLGIALVTGAAHAQEGIPPELVEITMEAKNDICATVHVWVAGERKTSEVIRKWQSGAVEKCEDRKRALENQLLEAKTKNKFVVFSPEGRFSNASFQLVEPPKDVSSASLYRSLIAKLRRVEGDLAKCQESAKKTEAVINETAKPEDHQ